jgi:hypothetical protein
MKDNVIGDKKIDEGYVAAYDNAQRLHTRLAGEQVEARRQADVFETQGKALSQIKEFAHIGFMLVSEATDEAFMQLWRKAFQVDPPPLIQALQNAQSGGEQELSNQNTIMEGDQVRVLSGSHTGEIATVGKIMWLSNQFGSYARVHLTYEGGKVADRNIDSIEKVNSSNFNLLTTR